MNIWIIGASQGIGRELAISLARQNHNLAISARGESELQNLIAQFPNPENHLCLPFDVLDAAKIKNSFDQIINKWQKIDLFIYASALYKPMAATAIDVDFAKQTLNVNFGALIDCLALIIPQMQKQKSGHIALIASVAGYRGLPNSFIYGASKAAMINLAETLYAELKPLNIAVSVINPGFVKTRLTAKNKFKMPFLITPEQAANEIIKGLEAKKFEIHFPKKFTYILKFLRIIPNFLFFKIAAKLTQAQ
jgi:short-subunit dehydrogenase